MQTASGKEMFTAFRDKLHSFRGRATRLRDDGVEEGTDAASVKPARNEYCRPVFLCLSDMECRLTGDNDIRPVVTPKADTRLPWNAGYAECVCARPKVNEDQAAVGEIKLDHLLTSEQKTILNIDQSMTEASLRGVYYGVFDGHGGPGAALLVAQQLINHLQEKLVDIRADLFSLALLESRDRDQLSNAANDRNYNSQRTNGVNFHCPYSDDVTADELIIGALEASFLAMDEHIAREKESFYISGGCCTLAALFICGKLYVANAGDCRAVAYVGEDVIPLSTDFTADQDKDRIYFTAECCPELLGGMFTTTQFQKVLKKSDIGQKVLCKKALCAGWNYKEVTEEDLLYPLITTHRKGKGSRLMNYIGVSRGLGDHDLQDDYTQVYIKPFISSVPEIQILDLRDRHVSDMDILVMGSDGLWDVISNQHMGKVARSFFSTEDPGDIRCTNVAKGLVNHARGSKALERGWIHADGGESSLDDITAFVIPLHHVVKSTMPTLNRGP